MKTLIKLFISILILIICIVLFFIFFSKNNNPDLGLLESAKIGDIKSATWLIEKGANINVQDKDGLTPLILAVINIHPEMLSLLLEKGADPNIHTLGPTENEKLGRYSYTALHLAAMNPDYFYVKEILKYNKNLEEKDARGMTPLMISIMDSAYENTKILLEAGADPNTIDDRGANSLIHATQVMERYPNIEIIELLIKSGADIISDPSGLTAIDYARTYEHPEADKVINFLKEHVKIKK